MKWYDPASGTAITIKRYTQAFTRVTGTCEVYRFYKAVVNSEMVFTKMRERCSLALRRVMSVEMNTVPSVGR